MKATTERRLATFGRPSDIISGRPRRLPLSFDWTDVGRTRLDEIGKLIGSGNVADVHELGPFALKLYKSAKAKGSAFREAANMAFVENLGLPVPLVHGVGLYLGRWGVVMDRVVAPAETDEPVGAIALAQLHTLIHAHQAKALPSLKERLSARIHSVDELDQATRTVLTARLEALPSGDRLCHGDFHPWNVLGSASRPIVIDWLDATCGSPEADVCRSYLLAQGHYPELAENYLSAYCEKSNIDRESILAWLPVLAAARLAENVPNERPRLMQLAEIK